MSSVQRTIGTGFGRGDLGVDRRSYERIHGLYPHDREVDFMLASMKVFRDDSLTLRGLVFDSWHGMLPMTLIHIGVA